MALTTEDLGDIAAYTTLSTHIVNILDVESGICVTNRQLTAENIAGLNDLYENIILRLNEIVEAQAPALP